jgi:hypothetical protein
MARKRRRFTPEFKARVALEALRERDSVQAIARRYELHPRMTPASTGPPESRERGPQRRRVRPGTWRARCTSTVIT